MVDISKQDVFTTLHNCRASSYFLSGAESMDISSADRPFPFPVLYRSSSIWCANFYYHTSIYFCFCTRSIVGMQRGAYGCIERDIGINELYGR